MLFPSFVQYKYVDSGHAKARYGAWGGLCGYCVAVYFWEDRVEDKHSFKYVAIGLLWYQCAL